MLWGADVREQLGADGHVANLARYVQDRRGHRQGQRRIRSVTAMVTVGEELDKAVQGAFTRPIRLAHEVRTRWQPQIRARTKQAAATTSGIMIEQPERADSNVPRPLGAGALQQPVGRQFLDKGQQGGDRLADDPGGRVVEERPQLVHIRAVQCPQSCHRSRPHPRRRVHEQRPQQPGVRPVPALGQPDDRTGRQLAGVRCRAPLPVPGRRVITLPPYDISCTSTHQRGTVDEERLRPLRPSRPPQRGDTGRTGTRIARGQQRRQQLVVGILVPQSRERRCRAQVLNHGVLVPGGRAGQVSGTEQSAFDGRPACRLFQLPWHCGHYVPSARRVPAEGTRTWSVPGKVDALDGVSRCGTERPSATWGDLASVVP
ncbi:hypothetical protein [Streptomyces scabiei]|uniref:hypothetical protein n=1 Tax=Streptomyces scabiei TaxID=1930 RepID=UPI000B20D77A